MSAPPVLAVCPAARCVDGDCPQPGRPRSGCAAGPFAPRGSHGACTSAGTAMGATRARLHHGSGSPLRGLPPHVRVQPRAAMRPWPVERSVGAMSAARRARPAARTLRTAVRSAAACGSSARTRSAVQGGRRSARGKSMRCAREPLRRGPAVPCPRYRAERRSPHPLATVTQGAAAATVKPATAPRMQRRHPTPHASPRPPQGCPARPRDAELSPRPRRTTCGGTPTRA